VFLSSIETKQGLMRGRIEEIKRVLEKTTIPTPSTAGVTNGLRIPYRLRDRLVEVQSRHQLGSVKETIFKALMLGLVTLERLPPMIHRRPPKSPDEFYESNGFRPLSSDEVSRLRDEGFNAPRDPYVDPIWD